MVVLILWHLVKKLELQNSIDQIPNFNSKFDIQKSGRCLWGNHKTWPTVFLISRRQFLLTALNAAPQAKTCQHILINKCFLFGDTNPNKKSFARYLFKSYHKSLPKYMGCSMSQNHCSAVIKVDLELSFRGTTMGWEGCKVKICKCANNWQRNEIIKWEVFLIGIYLTFPNKLSISIG